MHPPQLVACCGKPGRATAGRRGVAGLPPHRSSIHDSSEESPGLSRGCLGEPCPLHVASIGEFGGVNVQFPLVRHTALPCRSGHVPELKRVLKQAVVQARGVVAFGCFWR